MGLVIPRPQSGPGSTVLLIKNLFSSDSGECGNCFKVEILGKLSVQFWLEVSLTTGLSVQFWLEVSLSTELSVQL